MEHSHAITSISYPSYQYYRKNIRFDYLKFSFNISQKKKINRLYELNEMKNHLKLQNS